jgi:ADP-heptose:LPS heptosyltransferase
MKLELLIKKLFYLIFRIIFRNKAVEGYLDKDKIKNILILRYDAIGDMVVTVPAIRQLKSIVPNTNIDVLCSKFNHTLIEYEDVRNRPILESGFFNMVFQLLILRRNNYDLIISYVTNKNTKSGLISNLIGKQSCVKATIAHKERTTIYSALYNKQIDLNKFRFQITMLEIQLLLLNELFGVRYSVSDEHLRLKISQDDVDMAEGLTKSLGDFVVFNISSGNDFRTFSTNKNVEILDNILEIDKKHNYLLIYGPSDREKAEHIHSKLDNKRLTLCPSISITQVSAVIGRAKLVFTPDTSIVHIASSYKVPIFLLFSTMATNIREWYPYNTIFTFVKTEDKVPLETISNDKILNEYVSFLEKVDSTLNTNKRTLE